VSNEEEEEGLDHDLYLFMPDNIAMTRVCTKVVLSATLTIILISTIIGITNIFPASSVIGTQAALAQRINLSKVENDSTVTSGVKGTVFFTGADCPPTNARKVPPCSGPYPGYEVNVYAEGIKDPIKRVKTDSNGNYFVPLEPGRYIISIQAGPLESQKQANQVVVNENQIIQKDLDIDTGIR
jgi:hypothetical protein